MSRQLGEFLTSFVLPLVRGGEVHVGRPVSAADLEEFERQLPHAGECVLAVDEARSDVLAELVVRPPAQVLGREELALAACVHNLLFLGHPRTASWSVSTAAERRVLAAAHEFAAQPLAEDRLTLLARHGLLHNLFALSRVDVTVSWWTGRATFRGQTPPARLTTWRNLRRVREEFHQTSFDELFGAVEIAPVLAALLRRTPLTHLLGGQQGLPLLYWEDAVLILRDAELARAVAYRALRASDPRLLVAGPAWMAAAFEQMLERSPAAADVRAVSAFLVHLNALLALAELAEPEPATRSPLLTTLLAPERASQRPRGLTTLLALPAALRLVDRRLAQPPELDLPGSNGPPAADPLGLPRSHLPLQRLPLQTLKERWDQHRAQVAETLGEAITESLASRLRRHLRAVLE